MMDEHEFWCEDCKYFGHSDMGGEGWCDVYESETWYGKNSIDCPYFKNRRVNDGNDNKDSKGI